MNVRKTYFRLVAVLLGLSVFPLLEATCRLTGWGKERVAGGAFAEFHRERPLFTVSSDGNRYHVAEDRRQYFAEESFPAVKAPNVRRIFVFGGSTVQGRPFSIPTSFGTFLKIGLQHADPHRKWQVVNCGGISYASYRLLPIVIECMNYEPDLCIVCTGHNEFLECMTYGKVISASATLRESYRWLDDSYSVRLLRRAFDQSVDTTTANTAQQRTLLPEEVDALLDHRGGLEAYTRLALRKTSIASQFGRNLRQIANVCRDHSVPLMFVAPPSNLADCPPFKSEFAATLDENMRQEITEQLRAASDLQRSDLRASIELLKATSEQDPSFAFTWYQLGRSLLMNNDVAAARQAFLRARDEDVCPLRMTTPLEGTLRRTAEATATPYVDLHVVMQRTSRQGIVGAGVLVDHVHPSFRSNQQIAFEIIKHIPSSQSLEKPDGWKQTAQVEFDSHLQSLEDIYFLRGRQTLENLRAWTQGRADGSPLRTEDGFEE